MNVDQVEPIFSKSFIHQMLFDLNLADIDQIDQFKSDVRTKVVQVWESDFPGQSLQSEAEDYDRFLKALRLAAKGNQILKYSGDIVNLDWYRSDQKRVRKYLSQLKGIEITGQIVNSFNDLDLELKYLQINGGVYEGFNRVRIINDNLEIHGPIKYSFQKTNIQTDTLMVQDDLVHSFKYGSIQSRTFKGKMNHMTSSLVSEQISVRNWIDFNVDQISSSWDKICVQCSDFVLESQGIDDSFRSSIWLTRDPFKITTGSISNSLTSTRITSDHFTLICQTGFNIGNDNFRLDSNNNVYLQGKVNRSFNNSWIRSKQKITISGSRTDSFQTLRLDAGAEIKVSGPSNKSFNQITIKGKSFDYNGSESGNSLNSGWIELSEDFICHNHLERTDGSMDESPNTNGEIIYPWVGSDLTIYANNLDLELTTNYVNKISDIEGRSFDRTIFQLTGKATIRVQNSQLGYDFGLEAIELSVFGTLTNSFCRGDIKLNKGLRINDGVENSFNQINLLASKIFVQGPMKSSFNLINCVGSSFQADSRLEPGTGEDLSSLVPGFRDSLSQVQMDLSHGIELLGTIHTSEEEQEEEEESVLTQSFDLSVVRCQEFKVDGDVLTGFRTGSLETRKFLITGDVNGDIFRDILIHAEEFKIWGKINIGKGIILDGNEFLTQIPSSTSLFPNTIYPAGISCSKVELPGEYQPQTLIVYRGLNQIDLHPKVIPGLLQKKIQKVTVHPGTESQLSEFDTHVWTLEKGVELKLIQDVLYRIKRLVIKGLVNRGDLAGINHYEIERLEILGGIIGSIFYSLDFPKLKKLVLTQLEVDCLDRCVFPELKTLSIQNSSIPLLTLKAKPCIIEIIQSNIKLPNVSQPKILSLFESRVLGKRWSADKSYNDYVLETTTVPKGYSFSYPDFEQDLEGKLNIDFYDVYLQNCILKRNQIIFPNKGVATIGWPFGEIIIEKRFHVTSF